MVELVEATERNDLSFLKRKIFYVIELQPQNYFPSKIFRYSLYSLIVLNIIATALETDQYLYHNYEKLFKFVDDFTVSIFLFEYLLRIWTCTLYKSLNHRNYSHPFWGRVKYALTPYMLIDLLAILPFFLPIIIPGLTPFDTRFSKVFRALKLLRHSRSLKFFVRVIKSKIHELLVIVELILIILFIVSILMFYIENPAQPDKFKDVFSAMWCGVITLCTVGYGDIYPITPMGRFLSGIISILGICIFGLPTAVIVSGFTEQLRNKQMPLVCPHCHTEIEGIRRSQRKHF